MTASPGERSSAVEDGWTAGLADEFPALAGVRFAILGHSLWDPAARKVVAGGAETYILTLGELARSLGGDAVFLQRARTRFTAQASSVAVESFTSQAERHALLRAARTGAAGRPWVLISSLVECVPRPEDQPSVFLDHGILDDGTFDRRPRSALSRRIRQAREFQKFMRRRRDHLRSVAVHTRTIAVDTNVGNVKRSLFPALEWGDRVEYVPNFAPVLPRSTALGKWRDRAARRTVLFARRFVLKRGTYLWAEVLPRLAARHPDVEFRCVGHGRGGVALREISARHPNVVVLERPHEEMAIEHAQAHVSVVPTIWSEGTSLSAVEAMAAASALVTTDIGGLGNLVIPDTNGLIVPAAAPRVEAAVSSLLDDWPQARRLALAAYRIAGRSFSRAAWARRFCRVLADVIADPAPRPLARRVSPDPAAE